jgi:hypothetical protein
MSTKRMRRHAAILKVSEDEWKFLMDETAGVDPWTDYFLEYDYAGSLGKIWDEHGASVLAEWIEARPGSRPRTWWRFDAPRMAAGMFPGCFYDGQLPSPRLFLGGAGCPDFEALNIVPHLELGRPDSWLGFDADDPPMFESQAQYLDRHGLLCPRERRQLGSDAFEPETIQYEPHPLDDLYREDIDMQARIKASSARANLNRQGTQETHVHERADQ